MALFNVDDEVVCGTCCEEFGLNPAQEKPWTEQDIQDSIDGDVDDDTGRCIGYIRDCCQYCGEMA